MLQRFYQRRNKDKKNKDKKFIPWIERLLKTPIPDHRKYCIWRILVPYLVNVKHLSFEESFDTIDRWLTKCSKLEELDFDTNTKVNDCLNGAVNKGYLPISFDNPSKEPRTLKTDNRELYDLVKNIPKHKVAIPRAESQRVVRLAIYTSQHLSDIRHFFFLFLLLFSFFIFCKDFSYYTTII